MATKNPIVTFNGGEVSPLLWGRSDQNKYRSWQKQCDNFIVEPQGALKRRQGTVIQSRIGDLDNFVDSPWQWTTVRIRLKEHSTHKLKGVMEKIQTYLDRNYANGVDASLVGQTVLEVETNNAVTEGQLKSLGLAMIVIFGMMFVVFRSIPVGLVGIVANVLPILVNFGIMGWLGIRLDSATSMISAIGIGIIVDDTIHFLHRFGEALKAEGDYNRAVRITIASKGRPIIMTSILLFSGFGVVVFSKFVPSMCFGYLCALLMFNALWADLIVLPALLLVLKPKFRT